MKLKTILEAYGGACHVAGVHRMGLEYAVQTGNLKAHRDNREGLQRRTRQIDKFEDKLIEALIVAELIRVGDKAMELANEDKKSETS